MITLVDETKRNNRLLKDVPFGTVFSFVGVDVMNDDNGLYIKNQDDYMTDLKTGRLNTIFESCKNDKVIEYDIRIILTNIK